MADTATRLCGPTQLAASAATVYTVPALTTAVMREVLVANTTAGAVSVTVSIGADAAGTRILPTVSVPATSVMQIVGWTVLEAGETLEAYASASSSLTLTISGVEIT